MVSKDFRKFYFGEEADNTLKNMISMWSTFVSGFIDVDRMDYIVRDSQMAGIGTVTSWAMSSGVRIHPIGVANG